MGVCWTREAAALGWVVSRRTDTLAVADLSPQSVAVGALAGEEVSDLACGTDTGLAVPD